MDGRQAYLKRIERKLTPRNMVIVKGMDTVRENRIKTEILEYPIVNRHGKIIWVTIPPRD